MQVLLPVTSENELHREDASLGWEGLVGKLVKVTYAELDIAGTQYQESIHLRHFTSGQHKERQTWYQSSARGTSQIHGQWHVKSLVSYYRLYSLPL